ncbi:MAG: HAD family hydrolase [Bacteroidota bacterium]
MATPEHSIAVFDFDGTITRADSMMAFLQMVKGRLPFYAELLRQSPMLLGFKLGRVPRQTAKERFLTGFLGEIEVATLQEAGATFAQNLLPNLIRPQALERLRWHQDQGHACYLCTASLSYWTEAWAREHGMTLVATQGEEVGGRFTGKLRGINCYGPEKVRRIETLLDSRPDIVYAYGDSAGDRELLQWADEGRFRPFRDSKS